MKILFLLRYYENKASSRVRGFNLARILLRNGLDCKIIYGYRYYKYLQIFLNIFLFDVIYFQKRYSFIDIILNRVARILGKITVFDIDDAPGGNTNSLQAEKRAILMSRISNAVFCGSHKLKRFFSSYNSNIFLFPSSVDTENIEKHSKNIDKQEFTIGWIGDGISYKDELIWFALILKKIGKRFSGRVNLKFILIGALKNQQIHEIYEDIEGVECQVIDEIDWQNPQCVRSAINKFDIGIYPLLENNFNSFKCGYKAIQYMSMGIPVIASSIGENKHIILNGENGFLVKTENEWEECIASLLEDKKLYALISEKADIFIEDKFSLKTAARKFRDIIGQFMPIKVCMLVPNLDRIGGYEKQALALSLQLKQNNNQIFILTNKPESSVNGCDQKTGLQVFRLLSIPRSTPLYYLCIIIEIIYFNIKHFRKFSIVHSHALTHSTLLFSFIAKIFGKKSVIKIATGGDLKKLMHSRKRVYRLIIRMLPFIVDMCVSLNKSIDQELCDCKVPTHKIFKITNGVDIDIFKPLSLGEQSNLKKELNVKGELIVVFVGRFEHRKGADILIDSWKKVSLKFPGAQLFILGFGEEESFLIKKVKLNKINESVRFLGKTADIAKYLQIADIGVVPSRREGNPNTLLELLSTGLPVIASKIPGIEEFLIDGVDALLLKIGDIEQLSELLLLLLGDEKLRGKLSFSARKKAMEQFSLRKIALKYENLYKSLNGQ